MSDSTSEEEEELSIPQRSLFFRVSQELESDLSSSSSEESDPSDPNSSNPLYLILRMIRRISNRRPASRSTASNGPQTRHGPRTRKTKSPKEKKLTKMEPILVSEDVAQHILSSHGQLHVPRSSTTRPNVMVKLLQREHGIHSSMRGVSTECINRSINQHFLPTRSVPVLRLASRVVCGSFSQDGRLLVTTCQDGRIGVYNPNQGYTLAHEFKADYIGWSINDTALSLDSCHVAFCTWSPLVYHCNMFGDYTKKSLDLCPEQDDHFCVFSLAYSNDGYQVYASARDGCLYVYNLHRQERTAKVRAHEDDANALCCERGTDNIVFTGGDDGLCRVWDMRVNSGEAPKPVGVFAGHRDGITCIDTKGDNCYLITNSKDQSIKLWDLRKFSPQEGISQTRKAVSKQVWDYRWQAAPKPLCKMACSKMEGDTSVMTYTGHMVKHTLIRCHFSALHSTGQRYIYTGGGDGAATIFDVLSGEVVARLQASPQLPVRDVSWHPFSQDLVTVCWDGIVKLWSPSVPQPARVCTEEEVVSSDTDQYFIY